MTGDKNIFLRFPFFTLLLFVLLAYAPALLPFFHLKNDVITQNLPTRFFIGESVYSNEFPWWNPYMNFGFPQYADMNNGFWNPALWCVAYFFNYSVLSITIEEMFYILIGGWGIYLLCKRMRSEGWICLLAGISYISGGFIVGHLQHFGWIAGTAFFPFVVLFFLKCYERPTVKNFILGGISTFFFVSATHPGLIIGSFYFFLFFTGYFFLVNKTKTERLQLLKTCFWFLLFSIVLSPIVWISDLEGIQNMSRGAKVNFDEALNMPTTLQSYLSLLFPVAVNKGSFFSTDISMRNISIGLVCLFGLFCFFRFSQKKVWMIASCLMFFIFLAAGIAKLLFYNLPLLGYVRLNGEFAYFVFISFILLASAGLMMALQKKILKQQFVKYSNILTAIFILTASISIIVLLVNKAQWQFSSFKSALDELTFWHLLLINSIVQLFFLFLLKKYAFNKMFVIVSAIHLIVLTWFSLPFTGIGQMPRSKVQTIINTVPKGIFKPYQKPINSNSYIDSAYKSLFLEVAFYSKQIGYPNELQYPVLLNSTENFFSNAGVQKFVNKQSYLFLSTDTSVFAETNIDSTDLQINSYVPTHIQTTIRNNGYHFLILLQNNYSRWKVLVDKKPVAHFTAFNTFIGIPLGNGIHHVEYVFEVSFLKQMLYLNIIMLLIALVLLSLKKTRELKIA